MSILFLDCRYKLTEKTLLAGLLQLGASPEGVKEAAQLFPKYGETVLRAIQNAELDYFLQLDGGQTFPTPIQSVLDDRAQMPALDNIWPEIRQILPLTDINLPGATSQAILDGEQLVLLAAIINALQTLGVDKLYSSALPLALPEASDALLHVLQAGRVPLAKPLAGALVSPLITAFLAVRAQFVQPEMHLNKTAVVPLPGESGAQTALRLMLGETPRVPRERKMSLIQANLDDITPQQMAFVLERLTAMGARDVYQVPLVMKKNRMGMQLNAVVRAADEGPISRFILRETPTLGMRVFYIDDHPMTTHEIRNVPTIYGEIAVKFKSLEGEIIGAQPEYDVCVNRALELNLPLQQVMLAAQTAALESLKKS
ncbi:MAG: LarC family nickel insertion protein [Anaerolineae bacterium]|nr:LarC family nickel insertion protein [Anaerolineae bacterium]